MFEKFFDKKPKANQSRVETNLSRRKFFTNLGTVAAAIAVNTIPLANLQAAEQKGPDVKIKVGVPTNEAPEKVKSVLVESTFDVEVAKCLENLHKHSDDIIQNLQRYREERRYVENYLKTFKPKNIPPGVWAILKTYIVPLAVTESRFNPKTAASNMKALGLFQITKIAHEDVLEARDRSDDEIPLPEFTEIQNYKNSIIVALAILDESIFPKMVKKVTTLANHAKLSTDETEKLLAMFTLNAYNAGYGNVRPILDTVNSTLEKNLSDAKNSPEETKRGAKHLFDTFRYYAQKTKKERGHSYGKDAREYVLKIFAAKKFLEEIGDDKVASL